MRDHFVSKTIYIDDYSKSLHNYIQVSSFFGKVMVWQTFAKKGCSWDKCIYDLYGLQKCCKPQKQYVHLLAPPFYLIPIPHESTIASKVIEVSWNIALKAIFFMRQ